MDFKNKIPLWILQNIKTTKCSKCRSSIQSSDVNAMGVRKYDNKITPFIELSCPSCNNRLLKIFDNEKINSVEDWCYDILDSIKNLKIIPEQGKKKHNSPITDKEFSLIKKKIQKSKSHVDFLKTIGAYNYYSMLKRKNEK